MTVPPTESGEGDPGQVTRIAEEFIRLREGGKLTDLDEFCARYPEGQRAHVRQECEQLLRLHGVIVQRDPLSPGQSLGSYEVVAPIGRGGMGEVYRARDPKLDRDIAIKVLPPELACQPERVMRFEREAKAIAALDHPNIVTIYSVEESGGLHFITMQLIEGKTLSEMIPRKGLSLEKFFDLAIPLTDAISSAHEQGITHRDLKPANIMITGDGRVEILDFGLAKLTQQVMPERTTEVRLTSLTGEGQIVGTVAYMSPEQAEGKDVDHRTDIFSLGIILYEMVTGERPFRGETRVELMSSIMKDTPTAVGRLNPQVPNHLGRIIRRSLEKDPERRFQVVKDLRNELIALKEEIGSGEIAAPVPVGGRGRLWPAVSSVLFVALLLVVIVSGAEAGLVTRLALTLPPGQRLTMSMVPDLPIAISPDGRSLVYSAESGGPSQLFHRGFEGFDVDAIPGAEGGRTPFFSPDGKWLGFVAEGALQRVLLAGGTPLKICDATSRTLGASWGADDTIIFSPDVASGLWRVSADGESPQPLTSPNRQEGEVGHIRPQHLPDGDHVLFTVQATTGFNAAVLSLETGTWRTLVRGGNQARYLPTGHLVYYSLSSGLVAVPFDATDMEIDGAEFSIAVAAGSFGGLRHALFAVSPAGVLVYKPGGADTEESTLLWRNRATGDITPVMRGRSLYTHPRISPDGRTVALDSVSGETMDVWTYDLDRQSLSRMTLEGNINNFSEWTRDGSRLVFNSTRTNPGIYWKPADRSGDPELLLERGRPQLPGSWSHDGKLLAFTVLNPTTREDISVLSLEEDGTRAVTPVLDTRFRERAPKLSPAGDWLAYVSDESGSDEVYVMPYPGPGGSVKISNDGGLDPVWKRDGGEIYYRSGNRFFAVTIETEPEFKASRPDFLFAGDDSNERYSFDSAFNHPNFDVSADGQEFLMVTVDRAEGRPLDELYVVLNWFEELKRLSPVK